MRRNFFQKGTAFVLTIAMATTTLFPVMASAMQEEVVTDIGGISDNTLQREADVPKPQTDQSADVTKREIRQSLRSVDGLLEESDTVVVKKDSNSAMKRDVDDTLSIDVPKDPTEGVTLSVGENFDIEIGMPNVDNAKNAKNVGRGIVAYPGENGSANAVQMDEDGTLRMLTIIDSAEAATEYAYPVDLPGGAKISIDEAGEAIVKDTQGNIILLIEEPWAVDANDVPVETWFTTDGTSLVQHVNHRQEGIAYPVVADPAWFAAVGAVVVSYLRTMATFCALNVLHDVGQESLKWALSKHRFKYTVNDAGWSCFYGATFGGGAAKIVPKKLKKKALKYVTKRARKIIRKKIR